MTTVKLNGTTFDAAAIANLMDNTIREDLHSRQEWGSEQAFVDAYREAHREKYGEEFAVN